MSESRKAATELLETLSRLVEEFPDNEGPFSGDDDVADSLRTLVAHLGTGIELQFDQSTATPTFREIVTPWRKSLGDNADARYWDAPVDPDGTYEITGNIAGAVYVSFTVEEGSQDGSFPTSTAGVINDTDFDVGPDGDFTIRMGPGESAPNGMALGPGASRLTVRYYWEDELSPHLQPAADARLAIRLVDGTVDPGPRHPDDASIAASLRRLDRYLDTRVFKTRTDEESPAFVSRVPNEFVAPVVPGDHALAAIDAHYSMAPYLLGPDEALVVRGRWPTCRCANVNLWTKNLATFDYSRHQVSLNRAQTAADDEGRFVVVISAEDPGVDNWLDTEGRAFGMVFWRFLLAEGEVEQLESEVLHTADVRAAITTAG